MASELPSNGDGIASGCQWKVAHPRWNRFLDMLLKSRLTAQSVSCCNGNYVGNTGVEALLLSKTQTPNARYRKYNSIKQQKAIKLPNMIPSLLFFAPMRPINPLIPGT
jgi:hypothetical protein